jgi:hypothetical protein
MGGRFARKSAATARPQRRRGLIAHLETLKARAEDELERMGRPRQIWAALNVHMTPQGTVAIGDYRDAESVLGPRRTVETRPADLPTLLDICEAVDEETTKLCETEGIPNSETFEEIIESSRLDQPTRLAAVRARALDRVLQNSPDAGQHLREEFASVSLAGEYTPIWRAALTAALANAALNAVDDPVAMFGLGAELEAIAGQGRRAEIRARGVEDFFVHAGHSAHPDEEIVKAKVLERARKLMAKGYSMNRAAAEISEHEDIPRTLRGVRAIITRAIKRGELPRWTPKSRPQGLIVSGR